MWRAVGDAGALCGGEGVEGEDGGAAPPTASEALVDPSKPAPMPVPAGASDEDPGAGGADLGGAAGSAANGSSAPVGEVWAAGEDLSRLQGSAIVGEAMLSKGAIAPVGLSGLKGSADASVPVADEEEESFLVEDEGLGATKEDLPRLQGLAETGGAALSEGCMAVEGSTPTAVAKPKEEEPIPPPPPAAPKEDLPRPQASAPTAAPSSKKESFLVDAHTNPEVITSLPPAAAGTASPEGPPLGAPADPVVLGTPGVDDASEAVSGCSRVQVPHTNQGHALTPSPPRFALAACHAPLAGGG
jgi:hypothetical protein